MHHSESAIKLPGFRFNGSGRSFQSASVEGTKQGGDWFGEARKGGKGNRLRSAAGDDGEGVADEEQPAETLEDTG